MSDDTFLAKLRHSVAHLLPGHADAAEGDADATEDAGDDNTELGKAAPRPKPRPSKRLTQRARLDAALGELFAERSTVTVAGLHLHGLRDLDSRDGISGEERQSEVAVAVRRLIEQHLSAEAFYYVVADDDYILVWPDMDLNQVQVTLGTLAEKIHANAVDAAGTPLVRGATGAQDLDNRVVGAEPRQILRDLGARPAEAAGGGPAGATDFLAAAPEPDRGPQIKDVGFIYRPMWWAQRQRVATYLCQPAVSLSGRGLAVGERLYDFWEPGAEAWRVDTATLLAAAKASQTALRRGGPAGIAVPVHWLTITNAVHWSHYTKAAWSVPQLIRKRLVVEIVGGPKRLTVEMLRNVVQEVRPICRAVLLNVDLDFKDMETARLAGVRMVGCDVRHTGKGGKRLTSALGEFAEAAYAHHLGCYVHGLNRHDTTHAAILAGFDVIDGDIIGPLQRRPGTPYDLTSQELDARDGAEAASADGA